VCIPHAFFEGKQAWKANARKSTARTLKWIRQQYPFVFFQIPPDLVVQSPAIDIVEVI
jgi:hypothetical protein